MVCLGAAASTSTLHRTAPHPHHTTTAHPTPGYTHYVGGTCSRSMGQDDQPRPPGATPVPLGEAAYQTTLEFAYLHPNKPLIHKHQPRADSEPTYLDVVVGGSVERVDGVDPILQGRQPFQLHPRVNRSPPASRRELCPELERLDDVAVEMR